MAPLKCFFAIFLVILAATAELCAAARLLSEFPATNVNASATTSATLVPGTPPPMSLPAIPDLSNFNMKIPDVALPPLPSPKIPTLPNITILGFDIHLPSFSSFFATKP